MTPATLRNCIVALVLSSTSVACATYDDTAKHQACQDSIFVKDLPPQVAARESKCRSAEVWTTRRAGDDTPIDFGGKKK